MPDILSPDGFARVKDWLRKQLRRHRGAVITTSVILTAILLATGFSFWQAHQADQARELATKRLREVEESQKQSKASDERSRATIKLLLSRIAKDEVVRVEGMRPLYNQLMNDAIQSYTDLIATNPKDPQNFVDRADLYSELKKFPEARDDITAAIAVSPDDPDLHFRLAGILTQIYSRTTETYNRALEHVNIALESQPQRVSYLLLRGHIYVALKRNAEARNDYWKVEQLHDLTGKEYCELGRGFYNIGLNDLSLKYLRIAVGRDATSSYFRNSIGQTLMRMGRDLEALAEFSEAVRLDTRINHPGSRWSFDNRGQVNLKLKRYDDALADFDEHMKREPNLPLAYARRSLAHFHLQHYMEALSDMRTTARLSPDNLNIIYQTIPPAMAAESPDPEFRRGMLDLYTTPLKTSPNANNIFAWKLLTSTDPNKRAPRLAVDYLESAVEAEPANRHLWQTLGLAYYRTGDFPSCKASLESALLLGDEGHEFTHIVLSMAHARLGHAQDARESLATGDHLLKASLDRGKAQPLDHLPIHLEALKLIQGLESPAKLSEYQENIKATWQGEVWSSLLVLDDSVRGITLDDILATGCVPELPAAKLVDLHQQLRNRKAYSQAIAILRYGQKQHPTYYGIKQELAYSLAVLAKPPQPREAVAIAREALALEPMNPHAMCVLANALNSNEQYGEAIEHCQSALKLDPSKKWAKQLCVQALIETDRADEAVVIAQQLVDKEPKSVAVVNGLAIALRRSGRVDEAIVMYEKAIALSPKAAYLRNNLANALSDKGLIDEALARYRQAIELEPDDGNHYLRLGAGHADAGDLKQALDLYQQGKEKDPSCAALAENSIAWTLVNWPDVTLRDLPRALECAQRAVELAPDDPSILHTLGVVQFRLGDWTAAVESLDKCARTRGKPLFADQVFLAMCHAQLNQANEAQKYYDLALATFKARVGSLARLQEQEWTQFLREAEALLGKTVEDVKASQGDSH